MYLNYNNMLKLCGVLLACCCLVVNAAPKNATIKADCSKGPPKDVEGDKCCKFPDLFPDQVVNKCEKEFMLNDTSMDGMLADSCTIECVFNNTKLNEDSKVYRNSVIKYFMTRTVADKLWNPLITKAVDTCFDSMSPDAIDEFVQELTKEMALKKKPDMKQKLCHPISAFLLDCIYLELFVVCPAKNFQSTKKGCNSLQSYAKTCDDW